MATLTTARTADLPQVPTFTGNWLSPNASVGRGRDVWAGGNGSCVDRTHQQGCAGRAHRSGDQGEDSSRWAWRPEAVLRRNSMPSIGPNSRAGAVSSRRQATSPSDLGYLLHRRPISASVGCSRVARSAFSLRWLFRNSGPSTGTSAAAKGPSSDTRRLFRQVSFRRPSANVARSSGRRSGNELKLHVDDRYGRATALRLSSQGAKRYRSVIFALLASAGHVAGRS